MRHFIGACVAAAVIVAGCGSASTQAPPTSGTAAASAGQQTAPASRPAAGAPTSAGGAATGTLNVTLSGGLNGTLNEVRSIGLCSDPARTGVGYSASFQSALAGVAYNFVVTIGIGYKGPGNYATGTDDGTTVQMRGPTIRDVWEAVPGGKITVAADGSGTVDADLKNPTGSPNTHVKGTFACKK